MQKSAKTINTAPRTLQIIAAAGGNAANIEILANANPTAIDGKINGYPSLRIDI